MNIFGGRPGIAAGVLAVIATLAAFYLHFAFNIAILCATFLFTITCIILCLKGRLSGYRLFANIAVLAVFLIVMLRSLGFYYMVAPKAHELCGEDVYVQATVRERRSGTDYYTNYIIDINSVNGIECKQRAQLSCAYSSDLQKGYQFVLRHADIVYYDSLEESKAREMVADGIFLSVSTADPLDCAIITENCLTLTDRFEELNKYLCTKLRNEIKGDEGRLSVAMLLGDKSALRSETYRDFARAGLSHYLAVSGLHVSIITGIVGFALVKIGMKRSRRNLALSLFAVSYLFLLGFPISAVRAVVMLLSVFAAYTAGDVSDSLNSLGIAACAILAVTPYAVFETSFILSFCATLGIVGFMPIFNKAMHSFLYPDKDGEDKPPKALLALKRLVAFVFGSLMSVAAALSCTLLPTALLFGEMSRLGFRSNLIASVIATPLMISLLLYLVFGWIPCLHEALLWVIRKCAGYMRGLAAGLGTEHGALVSLVSRRSLIIIAIFTAVILAILTIKVKNKKTLLLLPATYPLILLLLVFAGKAAMPSNTEVTVLSSSGSEYFLVVNEDGSAIIDSSVGSLNGLRVMAKRMRESGITEIDTLVLTHYHTAHLSSVTEFVLSEKVYRVLLPYPGSEDDAWVMLQLAESLAKAGVACEIASQPEISLLGETKLALSSIKRLERSTHPVFYFSLSEGEEKLTYVCASAWEVDSALLLSHLNESSTVMLGSHGPVVKSSFELLENCRKAKAFLIFDESDFDYLCEGEELLNADAEIYVGEGIYNMAFGDR
jgi:ComEC/Rec2-related protein